jgi:hypothetical protein
MCERMTIPRYTEIASQIIASWELSKETLGDNKAPTELEKIRSVLFLCKRGMEDIVVAHGGKCTCVMCIAYESIKPWMVSGTIAEDWVGTTTCLKPNQ